MKFIGIEYAKKVFFKMEKSAYSKAPNNWTVRAELRPFKKLMSYKECQYLVNELNDAIRVALTEIDEEMELAKEMEEELGYKRTNKV